MIDFTEIEKLPDDDILNVIDFCSDVIELTPSDTKKFKLSRLFTRRKR